MSKLCKELDIPVDKRDRELAKVPTEEVK